MPIYEYKCKGCGEKFEAFRSIHDKDENVACPRCKRTHPRRIPSSVSIGNTSSNGSSPRMPT
jgi:putative FmdB family regulatory protein